VVLPLVPRHSFSSLLILVVIAATAATAHAGDGVDSAALAAIAAARAGDWGKAYLEAKQSKDDIALPVVRWLDFTRTSAEGRFAEIAAFIAQHPDWPLQQSLQRRAEAAMAAESDETAAAWFKDHLPISGIGMARQAAIMLAGGQAEAGTAALSRAWVDGDFSPLDERALLTRYGALLRPEDHLRRLDRLLWDGQVEAARRMMPFISSDYRALAEARLAVAGDARDAAALVARVPAQLRTDPGLAYDEAVWWQKHSNFDNAAQLLLAHPDTPVRPKLWWKQRMLVARYLLAHDKSALAYRLVQVPAAASLGPAACDAGFLRGLIALDFRKDPAAAFNDFSHLVGQVINPHTKTRAAYWAARSAAAEGKAALAEKWYGVGTMNPATFYGQLSAHMLGEDPPPKPTPEPQPDTAEQARFDAEPLVRATALFLDAGDCAHAGTFLMKLAASAKTELDFEMLGSLAERHGRFDLAIAVARRAIDAGMPLMLRGYPITTLPAGATADRPLLLAIVRQESEFARAALSSAGARGLMQLMPTTAQRVADRLRLRFSLAKLTTDGVYNITLGRSYIETLLDDFNGSYPLAIAAYNAGPGRVNQWLQDFGDPRVGTLGMVDWIELIPFNETRNYVENVLENLQIYRDQVGDTASAVSLVADLAR
jgi:soluble lytic murein transglycosylase